MQHLAQERDAAWHQADLARELANGQAAGEQLAKHLNDMGASNARIEVDLPDGTYLIFIKKI